jgi:hypothetical protein
MTEETWGFLCRGGFENVLEFLGKKVSEVEIDEVKQ